MSRDVKEIVGSLMRVVGGGEVSPDDVTQLGFEADGELQEALNDAYIKLLEFAHDRDKRASDSSLDRTMRAELQKCLVRISAAAELADDVRATD
jgi:hypothetical protein